MVVRDNDSFFNECQTQKLRVSLFFYIENLGSNGIEIGDAPTEAPKYSVIKILIKKYL